jgi:hypothetical protein
MDIKNIIIRVAVDADMRTKILNQFPHILDGYIVTSHGEVLSQSEAKHLDTLKYFLEGLNLTSSIIKTNL